MSYKYLPILVIALFSAVLQSCKKEDTVSPPAELADKMVFVYIAANNNLSSDAINTLNKLEEGYANDSNHPLLVYIKTNARASYLLKINHDRSIYIRSDTLKTYSNGNSSDPAFMSQVIQDARALAPAREYGLVLWSHATSWLPPRTAKVKSFGSDGGREMDLKDLKQALPNDFSFLLFDACYMGSLETLYELKDNARYLIASPSEVLADSFPYDLITPYLFGHPEDYPAICKLYLQYYAAQSSYNASATVCLVKSDALPQLAYETRKLLPLWETEKLQAANAQGLVFEQSATIAIYDFMSLLTAGNTESGTSADDSRFQKLKEQLNETILYKGSTAFFLGQPIKTFCGLGISLPSAAQLLYYEQLSWNKDAGWLSFLL